jgi:calcineurin-like phosphoesterase family protein
MRYWITADTHLGHDNLVNLAGRPEGFTEKVLKNLRNSVTKDDILIHLGDVCLGRDEYWHTRLQEVVARSKWLIRGNHDRKSTNWYMTHGWEVVIDALTFTEFGAKIALSHKPIEDSGYDINIHGHFHNSQLGANFAEKNPDCIGIINNKQKLVALEYTNYMPLNLEKLIGRWRST